METQIEVTCIVCDEPLEQGQAVFVCLTNLTDVPYTRWGYDLPIRPGHLRMQHRAGGKPRGVAHKDCMENALKQARLFKQAEREGNIVTKREQADDR